MTLTGNNFQKPQMKAWSNYPNNCCCNCICPLLTSDENILLATVKQDSSDWEGAQEISEPTSCPQQHHLWGQTSLLRALSIWVLKPPRFHSLLGQCVPLPEADSSQMFSDKTRGNGHKQIQKILFKFYLNWRRRRRKKKQLLLFYFIYFLFYIFFLILYKFLYLSEDCQAVEQVTQIILWKYQPERYSKPIWRRLKENSCFQVQGSGTRPFPEVLSNWWHSVTFFKYALAFLTASVGFSPLHSAPSQNKGLRKHDEAQGTEDLSLIALSCH